ncbi:hypothetical protein [Peribacillus acanthi]|uniref:hypothetical protein n=1 Tax=Peribacillus acanthi TaxID=2171554 RepID=UPI000D3EDB2E|nr:hypothetical protein [Peribacillus acanthi]
MNIEQKLEVIRLALEQGAHIKLQFHNLSDEKQAESIIAALSEATGKEYKKDSSEGTHWLEIDDYYESRLQITAFYNQSYMIEDINFEGVEEHA